MLYFGLGACHLLPSRARLYLWNQGKVPEPGTPGEGAASWRTQQPLPCRDEGGRDRVELGTSPFSPNEHVRLDHSVPVLIKDGATEISKMQ